jgi:hypothetical protein
VLRRLGFLFADDAQNRYERHVHRAEIGGAHPKLELAQGFDERRRLDVADRAAELDDAHVGGAGAPVDRHRRHALDPVLDRVGHVGHDLHRFAEVVAAPLALDHVLVHLPRRQVVVLGQGDVQEALIVAQVEVGLQRRGARGVGRARGGGLPSRPLAPTVPPTSPPSSRTNTSPCSKGDMVPASVLR